MGIVRAEEWGEEEEQVGEGSEGGCEDTMRPVCIAVKLQGSTGYTTTKLHTISLLSTHHTEEEEIGVEKWEE